MKGIANGINTYNSEVEVVPPVEGADVFAENMMWPRRLNRWRRAKSGLGREPAPCFECGERVLESWGELGDAAMRHRAWKQKHKAWLGSSGLASDGERYAGPTLSTARRDLRPAWRPRRFVASPSRIFSPCSSNALRGPCAGL